MPTPQRREGGDAISFPSASLESQPPQDPNFPLPFPAFNPEQFPRQKSQGEGIILLLWVVIKGSSSPRKAVLGWEGCSLFAWEQWDLSCPQLLGGSGWWTSAESGGFYYSMFNSNLGRISGRLHCKGVLFFFPRWQNGKRRWKRSDGGEWGKANLSHSTQIRKLEN